jgi:hypothetical protein
MGDTLQKQGALGPRDGVILLVFRLAMGELSYREHLKRLPKRPAPTPKN